MKTRKATKKTAAPRKDARQDVVVTLKKMPEKASLPAQAFAILEALKSKGGKSTVAELKKTMKARIESVQSMARLWVFYRGRLVEQGAITLAKQ